MDYNSKDKRKTSYAELKSKKNVKLAKWRKNE